MSHDPQGPPGGDYPPPRPGDPFGPFDGPLPPDHRELVRGRVQGPAIGLIAVGILNLILALASGWISLGAQSLPEAEFEAAIARERPDLLQQLKQMGWTVAGVRTFYIYLFTAEALMGLVTAILAIVAGARMLVFKSYGLAVTASVLAALPFISCSGCCGVGEGIGIWSLVVLLAEDVRASFR